jgi:hypothetical protein
MPSYNELKHFNAENVVQSFIVGQQEATVLKRRQMEKSMTFF